MLDIVKEKPANTHASVTLCVGANTQDTDPDVPIIVRAIANAKLNGINVHAGVRNLANGNCAFETVLDSINTRESFGERFNGDPDFWRNIWMTEVENFGYNRWNGGLSEAQWRTEWDSLRMSRIYECQLGDLILPGIAHCTRKDILIFNTSPLAHHPVYVVEASMLLDKGANTEIPICLAYDQAHYEMLVPNTEKDVIETIRLKKEILEGNYSMTMKDLSETLDNEQYYSKSENGTYAEVLKSSLEKNTRKRKLTNTKQLPHLKPEEKVPEKHLRNCRTNEESTLRKKEETENKDDIVYKNKLEALSNLDENAEEVCLQSLEELKLITHTDRTKAQKRQYKKLMYHQKMSKETAEQKVARQEKERLVKANGKKKETVDQKLARQEKERLLKANGKKNETAAKKVARKEKERLLKADGKKKETADKKEARQEKNRLLQADGRKKETVDQKVARQEKERILQADAKKKETADQKIARQEKERLGKADAKKKETPAQAIKRKEREKLLKATARKNKTSKESSARN